MPYSAERAEPEPLIIPGGDPERHKPAPPVPNQEPSDAGPLLEVARRALGHGKPSEAFLLALRAQAGHLVADVDAALAARAHRRRLADEGR